MRASTLAIIVLCLAACGDMRWRKPGSDDASLGNDLASCRVAARAAMQRMYGVLQPFGGARDPRFGMDPGRITPADRQMREQEAVGRCMGEKGYALVPADK